MVWCDLRYNFKFHAKKNYKKMCARNLIQNLKWYAQCAHILDAMTIFRICGMNGIYSFGLFKFHEKWKTFRMECETFDYNFVRFSWRSKTFTRSTQNKMIGSGVNIWFSIRPFFSATGEFGVSIFHSMNAKLRNNISRYYSNVHLFLLLFFFARML